jgi:hypothetical protein
MIVQQSGNLVKQQFSPLAANSAHEYFVLISFRAAGEMKAARGPGMGGRYIYNSLIR